MVSGLWHRRPACANQTSRTRRGRTEAAAMTTFKLYETLAPVLLHLERLGASVTLSISEPTRLSRMTRFEDEFGLPLPESLKEFYTEVADGLLVSWSLEEPKLYGGVSIASFAELRLQRQRWMSAYEDIKPSGAYVKDMDRAMATWERMKDWLPIHDEGSGDQICVDARSGNIVWYSHASADYTGNVIDQDILRWIRNWSHLCFGHAEGGWYSTTSPGARSAEWNSDEFHSLCRI
jgi:cell wall assembly regulator SMI1